MNKIYSRNNVDLSTLVKYIDISKYKVMIQDDEDSNHYQYEVVDKFADGCIQLMRVSWEERYTAANIVKGDYRKVKKMKVHKDFMCIHLDDLDMVQEKCDMYRFRLEVVLDRQEVECE